MKLNFLNIRGLSSKINELNRHLTSQNVSVFGIAESFLKSDERPFDLDNKYQWIGKCRKGSKSKGGIGLCVSEDVVILDENLVNSKSDSFERLWSLVRINNNKIAVGVVYFPNDGVEKDKTDALFYELLENITQFNNMGYNIVLMGDFNGRCLDSCPFTSKNVISESPSYNGSRLLQFVEACDLCITNTLSCCKGLYTRILNNQRSAIDYILMSKDFSSCVEQIIIDEDDSFDLHSDHVVLSVTMTSSITKCYNKADSVLKWKIDGQTDWGAFQKCLENVFESTPLVSCDDINKVWTHWTNNVNNAANAAIGKRKNVKKYRDFWDKELDELIKLRRVANRLKRTHNKFRPHDSEVGQLLSESYIQRKRAVQNAIKRKASAIKMRTFTDQCIKPKQKAKGFWQMLKDTKNNINPSQIIDPVDKTTLIDKKGKIEKCLIKHFGDIGKDSTISDNTHVNKVNSFLSDLEDNKIKTNNMFSLNVSLKTIEKALSGLKSGKAVGLDGVPNEFLKFGGNVMVKSLTDLFVAVNDLETIPHDWQKGIIVPLYKSAGSVYDLNNYRGITLTSNVYKIYAKILEDTIMDFLEDNNILGEEQGAFRKNRRIEDHLFSLNGICSMRKSLKCKTYIAFLDLSKAFDRVWRDGLFYMLWKKGIQGKVWRLLHKLYDSVENKVLFGNFESDWFDQDNGVKQGCVLSPTLFSILMKDLSDMLCESNVGITFASQVINSLLYADDVALLADSPENLQKMLDIAHKFACKWNLKFNSNKSSVLVIGQRVDKNKLWRLGNSLIEEKEEYKYLGIYFSRNLKVTHHITKYLKENIENKLNGMLRILGKHGNFNRIEFGNAIWNSVIRPAIAHGCSVWFPSAELQRNMLQSLQYKAAKITVKTKLNIPISALLLELGWEPINDYLDRQRIAYFSRFFSLPDTRLCKRVFNELMRKSAVEWPYSRYIQSLFESVGLDHYFCGVLINKLSINFSDKLVELRN